MTESPRAAPVWRRFEDRSALARGAAGRLADALRAALAGGARASLAVSGGSTPGPMHGFLSEAGLAWERVDVTLADERWVSGDHAASNARGVRDALLRGAAAAARFHPLFTGHETPEEGVEACAAAIRKLPRPFAAVALGVGEDGHTASLFPGAPGLAAALDPDGAALCAAMRPAPPPAGAPFARMTLTLRALCEARLILILVAGEAKRAIVEQACDPGAGVLKLPIAAVLRQRRAPVEIFWAP